MLVKNLSVLAVLVAYVAAMPAPSSHVVHEKRTVTNANWVKRAKTPTDAVLPVRIGLTQQNLEKGGDFLMDVSDPDSPNYANHWTAEQVAAAFAPSAETVFAVKQWLISSGINGARIAVSDNKGWLAFDATTAEMENLLHTKYYAYEHKVDLSTATSCEEYHIPKNIQQHIDYITPGVKLLSVTKRGRHLNEKRTFGVSRPGANTDIKSRRVAPIPPAHVNDTSTCDVAITPACIAALYQIPPGNKACKSNSMGIYEEGDTYSQTDLNLFFEKFTPGIPQGTAPKAAFIDGANAPTDVEDAGGESDLDFELAYPILWPQGTTLYQTDDINYATGQNATSGAFNTFLDALDGSYCTYLGGNDPTLDPVYPDQAPGGYNGTLQCGVYTPTNVISVSYGGQEFDLPASYQKRQCHEFMKLGLQGHSIFFASGDDGVAGPPQDDSDNGCLMGGKVFSPAWPNSCPYITNVGATKVYPGHKVTDPESAANDLVGAPYRNAYSSGGGFSNIYGVPKYQKKAVDQYFKDHKPAYKSYNGNSSMGHDGGVYNRHGRGYPDVAAVGDNISVYNAGNYSLSGGTSASTPIFASIINRINEERIAIGKKPVGFVNPALYAHPEILNDITNGTNPGCGTDGFAAVTGWDPVTGLGTPNYPKMLNFFINLK